MKKIRVLIMMFMLVGGLALLALPPLAHAVDIKAKVSVFVPDGCIPPLKPTLNLPVTPGSADFRDDVSTAVTEARMIRQLSEDPLCDRTRVSIETCDADIRFGDPVAVKNCRISTG